MTIAYANDPTIVRRNIVYMDDLLTNIEGLANPVGLTIPYSLFISECITSKVYRALFT